MAEDPPKDEDWEKKKQEVWVFVEELLANTRAEPGCIQIELTTIEASEGDKGGWELHEIFKDTEAQDAHKDNWLNFRDKVVVDYMRYFDMEQKKLLDTTKSGKVPTFQCPPAKIWTDETTGQRHVQKRFNWMV